MNNIKKRDQFIKESIGDDYDFDKHDKDNKLNPKLDSDLISMTEAKEIAWEAWKEVNIQWDYSEGGEYVEKECRKHFEKWWEDPSYFEKIRTYKTENEQNQKSKSTMLKATGDLSKLSQTYNKKRLRKDIKKDKKEWELKNKTNENILPKPYKKVKCAECGEEVCDKLDYKIGHLYNKHNCKPSVNDYKAKRMLVQYFPPVIKENMQPYAGVIGAVSIICDDDVLDMFGVDEYTGRLKSGSSDKIVPELKKLVIDGSIQFKGHELWYFENDAPTVHHLKKYFDF